MAEISCKPQGEKIWYVEILLCPITNYELSTFCSSGSFPREFAAETPPGMSYDLGDKSFIPDEISSSMQGRGFTAETGSGMAYNLGESFIPGEISRSLQVSFYKSVLRLPAV